MIKRFRSGLSFSLPVQKRIAWSLLIVFVVVYAIALCDLSILRYTTYTATAFDLGNMDQATWNTLHGHLFQFTNHSDNWYGSPIRLAQHVEPIFLLLSLLYVFFADPRTLLIFQTLALAAGALPVFILARKSLPTLPLFAPLMVLGYFLAPALLGENIFDFHPVTLVTPLLLYAVLSLTYRRRVWFVILCILVASCKEEMGSVVALLALLVIWKYKMPRLGLAVFIGGITWTAIAFFIIIPHFNVGAQSNNFWYRYAALGATPTQAIFNILRRPWIVFGVLVTTDRIYYIASLLRSTGYIALLAPEWLLPTLPSLAINLLASGSYYHNGIYHYHAAIIPFVIIAAIHGFRRIYGFWYGERGETTEQELLREDVVLNRTIYAPGKPIPGALALLTYIRITTQSFRSKVVKGWKIVISRSYIQRLSRAIRKRLHLLRERIGDLAIWLPASWLQSLVTVWLIAMMALNLTLTWPLLNSFIVTHTPGAREQEIQLLLNMIPANAVVSAGGNINPHLTERRYITVFPELTVATFQPGQEKLVDYVIVDLDNASPENKAYSDNFLDVLNQIQRTGEFRPIAEADGVILLVRVKS